MSNELTLHVQDKNVLIPPSKHAGFAALVPRLARLEQFFPPGAAGVQLAAAIIAEANQPALRECTAESLVKCAFNAAIVGLPPGSALGLCHFVPFRKGKGQNQIVECQLIFGFKGVEELAYDCGFLACCFADVVLRGEEFTRTTTETGPHFTHTPFIDHEDKSVWESVIASYCVWRGVKGGEGFACVGRKELDKLKARGNVWDSAPIPMAKKTAILRAAKNWKRRDRLAHAAAMEDAIEADIPQPSLLDAPLETEPEKPRLEAFAEQPPEPAGDDEATTMAQWIEEIATLTTQGELDEAKQSIPHTLTLHGQQTIMSAIERREAEIAK